MGITGMYPEDSLPQSSHASAIMHYDPIYSSSTTITSTPAF